MPWKVSTSMSQRTELCQAAQTSELSQSDLCRQFGVSRKTGYKWVRRFKDEGVAGLDDRSRRPHHHPHQTDAATEAAVVAVRREHPRWGGRKIAKVLARQGMGALPHPSTITNILHRHGLIDPETSSQHRPFEHFVMATPNQLWQMDFKGYFALGDRSLCHPLTLLDDHSRFLLALQACPDESRETVQAALTTLFRSYGLPERILADNGSPWGFGPALTPEVGRPHDTRLTVWRLRLGVAVSHGRARHPQTQGKEERLHRTLKEELLLRTPLPDFAVCQEAFDRWRHLYNHERPHQALDFDVPAAHYAASLRPFPESLPAIVYDEGASVRTIDAAGRLAFHNQSWRVGKAFRGEAVAVTPTLTDGCFAVCYGPFPIYTIDLTTTPGSGAKV